jgi:hypothetical protein
MYSTICHLGVLQKMVGVACVTSPLWHLPLRQIFAAILESTVPPPIELFHSVADVDDGIIGCKRKGEVHCCMQWFAVFAST